MAYYLPSSSGTDGEQPDAGSVPAGEPADISDLKIYWGPEICRLEYLLHLMETGRIVDEYHRAHA
jgi:hypothetical protein